MNVVGLMVIFTAYLHTRFVASPTATPASETSIRAGHVTRLLLSHFLKQEIYRKQGWLESQYLPALNLFSLI